WFESALVFTAQWFSLGGMRCSPLNAALDHQSEIESSILFVYSCYDCTSSYELSMPQYVTY
ncbi:hypothetical protein P3386_24075, partial [Vibrio parahaemolyticus]|nr:hypothetical protein [Vibrio parahaemolyticus]